MKISFIGLCTTLAMFLLTVGCQSQSMGIPSPPDPESTDSARIANVERGIIPFIASFPASSLTPSLFFTHTPTPMLPAVTPKPPSATPVSPTKIPTRRPTVTPVLPTKLPTRRATATTQCFGAVAAQFRGVFPQLQSQLGCAGELINTTYFAYQKFHNGRLIWRGMEIDDQRVYPPSEGAVVVLYGDGSWEIIQIAKFDENRDPQYPCAELRSRSPSNTPKRGFGKLLCAFPNVHSRLGEASSPERGDVTSFVQFFDGGFLVHYQDFERGGWFTIAFFFGGTPTR